MFRGGDVTTVVTTERRHRRARRHRRRARRRRDRSIDQPVKAQKLENLEMKEPDLRRVMRNLGEDLNEEQVKDMVRAPRDASRVARSLSSLHLPAASADRHLPAPPPRRTGPRARASLRPEGAAARARRARRRRRRRRRLRSVAVAARAVARAALVRFPPARLGLSRVSARRRRPKKSRDRPAASVPSRVVDEARRGGGGGCCVFMARCSHAPLS